MAEIKKISLKDLVFDRLNANKGTERGRYALEKSLEKYGAGRSLLLDAKGRLIAGNKTAGVAGEMGFDDVIVVQTTGNQLVAVQRTDLDLEDDAIARELAVSDNRTGELSLSWDSEVLQELMDGGVDLSDFFKDDELDALINAIASEPLLNEEEDEENTADLIDKAESGAIESRVKNGDIWACGRHRVCCGDSTDEGVIKALLGDRVVALCHADPPYGMGKEKDGVINDNLYREKLDAFQMQWWEACRPFMADNGSAYIWGNAEDLWRLWYSGGLKKSERLTFRNQIVWNKEHGQGMLSEDFRMYPTVTEHCLFFMLGEQGFSNNADNYWDGWEPIRLYLKTERDRMSWDNATCKTVAGHSPKSGCHWFDASQWTMPTEETYNAWRTAAEGKAFKREYEDIKREYEDIKREYEDIKREWYSTRAYFNNTHDSMTDVWSYPRVQGEERWSHATPKPVDMISRIYKSSSPDNGMIYSPFLGSGTDIMAAQKMEGDRTVYGCELSEQYCELILRRFEAFTGQVAQFVGRVDQ